MPFVKGQHANPNGAPKRERFNLKWDEIDGFISKATQKVFAVVDGTHPDLLLIKEPEKRLELILKATGHLLKLAPQRQANADGDNVPAPILAYVSSNNSNQKDNGNEQANPGSAGGNVSKQNG